MDFGRARVFLVGMMGCGKSTVGACCSRLFAIPYLDNDALLLAREGSDLMGLAGEGAERLHAAESAAARDLAVRPPPFVAGVAASVVERPVEVALLRRAGFVVYLRARPTTLLGRVRSNARPWMDEDPLGWIAATLARRGPLFERFAHLVLDTDDTGPEALAERVAAGLEAAPAPAPAAPPAIGTAEGHGAAGTGRVGGGGQA